MNAIAAALDVALAGIPDVNITALSKALRSAGGNSFANMFRGDHELPYRHLLADLVPFVGQLAGFPRVAPGDELEEAALEDYILEAVAFLERPTSDQTAEARAIAQIRATNALKGSARDPSRADEIAGVSLLAAGGAAIVLGTTALPLALAYLAIKWAKPALRKTLSAVVVLIAIRKRIEREQDIEAEELAALLRRVDLVRDGHISANFMRAHEAFAASRLDDAIELATTVRGELVAAIALAVEGRGRFPNESAFETLHADAGALLASVERFLNDMHAFAEL